MDKKKLLRKLKYFGIIVTICVLILVYMGYSIRLKANAKRAESLSHLIANKEVIVNDAKKLKNTLFTDDVKRIDNTELPPSLSIPYLIFAELYSTHINLITYTSPDVVSGYRVWISARPQDYKDNETSLEFVTRYTYIDDYPISESNRP